MIITLTTIRSGEISTNFVLRVANIFLQLLNFTILPFSNEKNLICCVLSDRFR